MNRSVRAPRPFHIVSSSAGPRFLGLPLAERNRRVAMRGGGVPSSSSAEATLTVPEGVAVTPSLWEAIPVDAPSAVLAWRDDRQPLIWETLDRRGVPTSTEKAAAQATRSAPVIQLPEGAVLDVSTPAARRRSAWRLLKASGKPQDGWLSRHVHRKISRVVSYVFLQLGLSANVATLLTFAVGALGAWLMAQTSHLTMVAGALLYWGSSIADGIDGEMARLTMSESAFGEQLDTGVDQATHLLALAGAGVGWWRQGVTPAGLAVVIFVAVGTPLVLLWAMALVRRARGTTQFFVVTKPIELAVERAARDTGSLVLRAAASVFVLFRREAFSFTFFLVSLLTGLRLVVPALVGSALLVVSLTFVFYRPALDKALVAALSR
jgi:phosphatidylglycerophosphate synthase